MQVQHAIEDKLNCDAMGEDALMALATSTQQVSAEVRQLSNQYKQMKDSMKRKEDLVERKKLLLSKLNTLVTLTEKTSPGLMRFDLDSKK